MPCAACAHGLVCCQSCVRRRAGRPPAMQRARPRLISGAARGRTNERAQSHRITSTSSIGQHPRPRRRRDHVASLLLRVWRRTGQPHSAVRGSILLDSGVSVALRLASSALLLASPLLALTCPLQPACPPPAASVRQDGREGTEGARGPGAQRSHAWPARPSANLLSNHGNQAISACLPYFALSCFACARAGRRRGDEDAATAAAVAIVARALLHLHLRRSQPLPAPAQTAAVSTCACVPLLLRPLVRPSPTHRHPSPGCAHARIAVQSSPSRRAVIVALSAPAKLVCTSSSVRSRQLAEFRLSRSLRRLV